MAKMVPLPPTHLSIFVTDPDAGDPVQRLPLYAEVAAPRLTPPRPPADDRLREPARAALFEVDPDVPEPVRDRVEAAALQALGQALDDATLSELLADLERTRQLFRRAFKATLVAANRERMAQIPASRLPGLILAAVRAAAAQLGLPVIEDAEETGVIWAEPLGVLTTDHVGYASFDLTRLRPEIRTLLAEVIEARRQDPDAQMKLAIWIYPYGQKTRFDALSQARFAFDAIVARLEIAWHTLPDALINMGPRALQNPGLTDWRLSPASFAASPKTLVGADGCEELAPASLALQQFVLRQVVRLTGPQPDFGIPTDARFKAAYVDDYKVTWYQLGHSLGEILYSLPLAPGETVKLAVIDWSWDSLSKRDETTRLTEDVLHQQHRNRTITETVKAGIKELQHGSSFMGGVATSAGATAGANLGQLGLGGAFGNTWSLGGSTATSDGSRELAAENVQRVNDSFTQASSVQREINSTVVIQARQEQQESIQTRTFSNYNHSHTLTVLYYEVLRHFRVTVEWVRRRRAVLAKVPRRITSLGDAAILNYRYLLEQVLLEPSLKAGFDALEKREAIANYQTVQSLTPGPVKAPWWEGDVELELFEIGIWASDDTIQPIVVYIITAEDHANSKTHELHYVYKGLGEGIDYAAHNINSGKRMETDQEQFTFLKLSGQPVGGESKRIRWADVLGFQFEKWGNTEWRIDFLSIRAWDRFGFTVDFTPGKVDVNLFVLGRQPGSQTFSAIKRPGPPPAQPAPILSPAKSLTSEESFQIKRLTDHINAHIDHYIAAIQLATDPNEIAVLFENEPWAPGTMDDHVEPTPLDVFGTYVAYPLAKQGGGIDDTVVVDIAAALNGTDPARRQAALDQLAAMSDADRVSVLARLPLAQAKSERLVTLPTRGVFAEGKLGHCNISEQIDETRFWKWEEHPIPIEAPAISPVTPVQPSPQPVTIAPTAFPAPVVNIVQPTAEPEPHGLAQALTLLGTSNIFRDMSGRTEVADLLKKLSDNSISIAEAANKARDIQAKYGTELDKQQKDYDKAVADLAFKASEAQAQREAPAAGTKQAAEVKKANVEAAVQQAEAAKHLPEPMREEVLAAAAKALAGNPVKSKVVTFQALGFDRIQALEGEFALTLRDMGAQRDVVAENKVGPSFGKTVSFPVADPVVKATVRRLGAATVRIQGETVSFAQAEVNLGGDTCVVGADHKMIDVTLTQGSREVKFQADSTNAAITALMAQWGTALGVAQTVAQKLVADFETRQQIVHAPGEQKAYSFTLPTQSYELSVTSK